MCTSSSLNPGELLTLSSSDQRAAGEQDLLGQLPLRRLQGRLAVLVAQPGRQLPQVLADRVPVLPQQDDAVLVVQRHDGDRARVVHDLPDAVPPPGMATVSRRSEMTRPS